MTATRCKDPEDRDPDRASWVGRRHEGRWEGAGCPKASGSDLLLLRDLLGSVGSSYLVTQR